MRERGGLGFILFGLVIGLALSLLVSLVISPVKFVNITPGMLSVKQKDIYRGLIAASYNARGDLDRAKARIALLKDVEPVKILAAQAQQTIAQGGLAQEARGLALLAAALNQQPIDFAQNQSPTLPQVNATPSQTPFPTLPALDISTPVVETTPEVVFPTLPSAPDVLAEPFVLKDRKGICDLEAENTLQVYVIDKAGKPVPAVEVIVTWDEGEDHFFTGLKPQIDAGYADFLMNPEKVYNMRLSSSGEMVTKITPPNCKLDSGMEYKGGIKVIFGPS